MRTLLLILVFYSTLSTAQHTGCFTDQQDSGLAMQTSIDFSSYDAFFVGEFHGVRGVPEIKLALIKYLNENYGITDVFMEVGYSAAYLFNSFLATGDTVFITHPHLIYTAKQQDMDFWLGLYNYNQTLARKVTIRGMDFERIEFLSVLKQLGVSGHERPKEIASVLRYIDTVKVPSPGWQGSEAQQRQDSIYKWIRGAVALHRESYRQYYGDDYSTVAQMLLNENTLANFPQRNAAMYANILRQAGQDSIKKFLVFSGLAHADKAREGSVCNLLCNNKKYKLADIAMTCKNCYDWQQPEKGIQPFKAPYTYYKDTALMNGMYGNYFNGDCRYMLLPANAISDNKVRRYSDYIILMKDQLQ